MSPAQSIPVASQALAKFWTNSVATKWVGVAGFIMSLVPLPGVQQAGQVADRLASNTDSKRRMEDIWGELARVNSQLARIDDLDVLIAKIATTVQNNDALQAKVQALAADLSPFQESFTALAERSSLQTLVNSLIEADEVSIVTQTSSRTEVNNTTIKAKRTHLHTTGGSRSEFNNADFLGQGGSIGMNNVSTQGNLMVEGSGIAFGAGSALVFHAPQLKCGGCGMAFHAPNGSLPPGSMITCPGCKQTGRLQA